MIQTAATAVLLALAMVDAGDPGERTAPDPVEVAVRWSGISDATLERCGFNGLENYLLQGMIDAGYAVAAEVDERGIRLQLAEAEGGITVRGALGGHTQEVVVPLDPRCDATIQIALVDAARAVADTLAAKKIPVVSAQPTVAPLLEPDPVDRGGKSRWMVGVGGIAASRRNQLIAARGAWRFDFTSALACGPFAELGVASTGPLLASEIGLGGQALWQVSQGGWMAVDAGVELAVLEHLFDRDDLGFGGHTEMRAGLVLEAIATASGVGGTAVLTWRSAGVQHWIDERLVYDAGHWGFLFMFGWHSPRGEETSEPPTHR